MTTPSPRSSSRTPIVIGVVVALVAVVAVVAIVLAGGDDGGNDSASTLPITTQPDDAAATGGGGIDPLATTVQVAGDALPPLTDPASDSATGHVAPTLTGTDYDGTPTVVEPGADGRPMLVVFLAHWCPHCNAEVPRLVEWRDSGEFPADLDVVAVSTAVSPDRPNYPPGEWLRGEDWRWPVLADSVPTSADDVPSAATAYGVTQVPFFALLDADGRVVARRSGEVPIDDLAALVAGVTGTG